jgi:hypothetical protein
MRRAISRAFGRGEQELRWRQISPSDPHAMLTSRVVDFDAEEARRRAAPA